MSIETIKTGSHYENFAQKSNKEFAVQQGSKSLDIKDSKTKTAATAANQEESERISEKELIETIEHANSAFVSVYTSFEFSIHEQTKEIMVKVLNRDTGEIIREIPPEKTLDMVAKLWEMAGILVDEKR